MSVYERLGVRPVINARGTNTMASGSLMDPRVLSAMAEAAEVFVDMAELNARAGEHIARLLGVEAAHVTSGAAGGLLLAAAACLAGADPDRVRQLPDTTGMRDEIVIQKCQRFGYDQALRTAGARLVEAGDAERCAPAQVEAVIGARTAALISVVSPNLDEGGVPVQEMVRIAHARGLPLIVDAASTLPPSSNLTRWTSVGADLVIYSGGKGIRGPQGSGLLLGRAEAIRAAAANGAPNAAVGRPCKVSKEDIVGLVVALELFMETDHRLAWERHLGEARQIAAALDGIPGVEAIVHDDAIWPTPIVLVALDERATGLTAARLQEALRRGDPPIMVRPYRGGRLLVDTHNLRGDEAATVARRMREELSRVPAGV
jgi:D-glucosaminate-6-phosphate ammonia-lyase